MGQSQNGSCPKLWMWGGGGRRAIENDRVYVRSSLYQNILDFLEQDVSYVWVDFLEQDVSMGSRSAGVELTVQILDRSTNGPSLSPPRSPERTHFIDTYGQDTSHEELKKREEEKKREEQMKRDAVCGLFAQTLWFV